MSRTDLVIVKAFGDLVIALAAIARAPAEIRGRHRLLIGAHLVPLFDAVGMPIDVEVVEHGEPGVPACFDARRQGAWTAARSAWRLRRAIRVARSDRLLFDRLGPREKFLAGGVEAAALPASLNIYLAYAAAFDRAPEPTTFRRGGRGVGIFPGSRVARKNMPEADVRAAIAAIERRGLAARLMLLKDERSDLEASGLSHTVVPRSFAAMIQAVADCSSIVAADSMPAHIAELHAIPVHVLSPVDNRYWLPRSAFVMERWSLFAADVDRRIGSFLAAVCEGSV